MELVKDILLTDSFMVKCYVETGGMRLSDYLDNLSRAFISVRNVTMIDVREGTAVSTHEALIRKEEIIIAHELLDVSGDRSMKNLVDAGAFSQLVDLHHKGRLAVEITGRMRPEAHEGWDKKKNFFVVLDARLQGLEPAVNAEFKILESLPYAIINRRQISYIFKNYT